MEKRAGLRGSGQATLLAPAGRGKKAVLAEEDGTRQDTECVGGVGQAVGGVVVLVRVCRGIVLAWWGDARVVQTSLRQVGGQEVCARTRAA